MKDWKRYGPISVCFWSLLLVLVGISQLTFGAYYISKLPVFKIGSPVWIGFLNVLCGAALFGLHHKTMELRQHWCRTADVRGADVGPIPRSLRYSSTRRAGQWGLYLSLFLSLMVVFINATHVIICEVGEWQHWLTFPERQQLKTEPLSHIAIQAYRVTNSQVSVAIILGVICTSLNLWRLYRDHLHNSGVDAFISKLDSGNRITGVIRRTPAVHPSVRPKKSSSGGFDNATWVYGDDCDGVQLHPEPTAGCSVVPAVPPSRGEDPSARKGTVSTVSGTIRYATIRRAPSILPTLPDNFTNMRNQVRSCSFRVGQQQHPAVAIQRSKTIHEASLLGGRNGNGFAQRFQLGPESSSDLVFMHDGLIPAQKSQSTSVQRADVERVPEEASVRLEEVNDSKPEKRLDRLPPVIPHHVRTADRIVLRVESFRTQPIPVLKTIERFPSSVGVPGAVQKRPIRNIKRVSSSTQTELSVLRNSSVVAAAGFRSNLSKRLILPESKPPLKPPPPLEVVPLMNCNTPESNSMQVSPGYSVGSSSGYSSPRGTGSKSSTPEPLQDTNVNVTVIQIDPPPAKEILRDAYSDPEGGNYSVANHPVHPGRHSTPIRPINQHVQTRPIHRSVSFHQQDNTHSSSAGRNSSHIPNNNWIYSSMASDSFGPPIIPIPRPALRRYATPSTASTVSRRSGRPPTGRNPHQTERNPAGTRLNRSTSVYMAMSEIQRKLEMLQSVEASPAPVPIHGMIPHEPSSDSGYQDEDQSWCPLRPIQVPGSLYREFGSMRRSDRYGPSGSVDSEIPLEMDSAQTLAYLSELENLARHWKTQLMYKVEQKSTAERTAISIDRDSFQC